jgi:hypothetical protein
MGSKEREREVWEVGEVEDKVKKEEVEEEVKKK